MYSKTSATFLLLANVLAQTPPNFTPQSTPATQFTASLSTTASESSTYFLALVDPDAPTPLNASLAQYLHFLQPDVTSTAGSRELTISGPAIAPYVRPQPPTYSDAHRYIELLFLQPANFAVPDAFSGFGAENRTNFDIAAFAAAAGLGEPVAANYFLVANNTAASTSASGYPTATAAPTGTVSGGPSGTGSPTASISPIQTGGAIGSWAVSSALMLGAAAIVFGIEI